MNLGLVLGGVALVGIGIGIGAIAVDRGVPWLAHKLARQQAELVRLRWDRVAILHRVAELTDHLEELRDGIPEVWESGFKAARDTDEWTLVAAEVQRRQREHGGGRS